MTLTDLLRTQTLEVQDALNGCENRIRGLGSEKRTYLSQIEVLESEINAKRAQVSQEESLVRQVEVEIRDIERKIEELRHLQDQLIERKKGISLGLTNVEQEINSLSEQKKRAKTTLEEHEGEVRQLIIEKERWRKRLLSARRIAVRTYLGDLGNRLIQIMASQEEQSEKMLARKRLEEARHQDHEIMNLYEARTELQKLLKIANITAVRQQLEQQLKQVELQIETCFPGALRNEVQPGSDSQIEEIFFAVDRSDRSRILLPISLQTWGQIARGEVGKDSQSALRLIWGVGRALGKMGALRLKVQDDLVVMTVSIDLTSAGDLPDISMPLPGSGIVSLLFSKLPHELQEAISDEDSDQ